MIRLTQNTKSRIRSLYLSGQSQQSVGDALNLERTVVGYWVRKLGIARTLSESHKDQHSSPATEFKRGVATWNKGKPLPFRVWNKGIKTGIIPPNSFKLGHLPPKTAFQKCHPCMWKGKKRPELSGSNNVNWKGGVSGAHRTIRSSEQYQSWRRDVFVRDRFTCQQCGHRFINIVAHHIKSFSDYPDLRFDR